jgi:hypothetical protein
VIHQTLKFETLVVTDDMLDRHAAQGSIAADKFRRGADYADEPTAIKAVLFESRRMAKADGIRDDALAGFLAMGAVIHFHLRVMDAATGEGD